MQIKTNNAQTIMSITEFAGLNQDPDGETAIKNGEFSEMRNFRITDGKHLQTRPGCKMLMTLDGGQASNPEVRGRWHGWLNNKELTVAAYGEYIYALDFETNQSVQVGQLDRTDEAVAFFAFDNKLYQTGNGDCKSWDGNTEHSFVNVSSYVPIVSVSTTPAGSGMQLEAKNIMTKNFRVWFSPDGSARNFVYPVSEPVLNLTVKLNGQEAPEGDWGYTQDDSNVTVQFNNAVASGSNTLEVQYNFTQVGKGAVGRMKYAELFNGSTDTRVFLYGDGSNVAYYSGIPYDTGRPSAEYFPALNELAVGDASTPITSLVRHYSRMLAFKPGSAWVVSYGTIDLADGSSTAAFYVQPVNRQLGNLAPGQVHLLENDPLTMDGSSVYQWKSAGYSAYITSNENNAKRISDRVAKTLREHDLSTVRTENLRTPHEYWFLLGDGKALILNYASDAWYYYDDLPFNWVFEDGTETYGLGDDGKLYHFSRRYRNDDGEDIDAYAATGAMDFDRDWLLKYSPLLFVALQPESGARVTVTTESDRKSTYPEKLVSAGLSTFLHADFAHWAFGTNRRPKTKRVKIKVKKATYYRIIYKSRSATATATVLQTDVKLRYAGNVK